MGAQPRVIILRGLASESWSHSFNFNKYETEILFPAKHYIHPYYPCVNTWILSLHPVCFWTSFNSPENISPVGILLLHKLVLIFYIHQVLQYHFRNQKSSSMAWWDVKLQTLVKPALHDFPLIIQMVTKVTFSTKKKGLFQLMLKIW